MSGGGYRRRGTEVPQRGKRPNYVGGYFSQAVKERLEEIGGVLEQNLGTKITTTQLLEYVIMHCPVPAMEEKGKSGVE